MKKYKSVFKENQQSLREAEMGSRYANVNKVMDLFFDMSATQAMDMFESFWSFYAANPADDAPWMEEVAEHLDKVVKAFKKRQGD